MVRLVVTVRFNDLKEGVTREIGEEFVADEKRAKEVSKFTKVIEEIEEKVEEVKEEGNKEVTKKEVKTKKSKK